jgi:hypothetical protein
VPGFVGGVVQGGGMGSLGEATGAVEVGAGTDALAGGVVPGGRRFRGKNKQAGWRREAGATVSVVRLPLVVDAPADRRRLERLFSAMWSVKRALQRDARARVDAYWAGSRRREVDANRWRAGLGLSREGLERAAYAHVEGSGFLGHHVTKALVMHQADEVWNGVARHLFGDAAGKRAGRPRVGGFWDYTRIPGRARSHTTGHKWETFRLHGTLAGHLEAYRHPNLPDLPGLPGGAGGAVTAEGAAALRPGMSVLAQPRRMRAPDRPAGRVPTGKRSASGAPGMRAASWWDHTGPLTLVFTGGAHSTAGELVLPVRLPQGSGRWPYLVAMLGDPALWHKIDLVRRRAPSAPGGWAYEAHLMVLAPGYASPATRERRAQAAGLERVGGVDGNVSNLSVVSFPATGDPQDGQVEATRISPTEADQARYDRDRRKVRGRQRALERSRRATNPAQYRPSKRQVARAERRTAARLPERTVGLPKGARVANSAGVPAQAYRKDALSNTYRRTRARKAADARTRSEARRHRARQVAAQITGVHGGRLTVEDCDISTWFRLWGKACAAFTPGLLIAALATECEAITGDAAAMARASTQRTAMSQHCLCGARVPKSLRDRIHHCPHCGLTADRDMVSAALGAFVCFTDPTDPSTARVDFTRSRHAMTVFGKGLQVALSESTATLPAPSGRGHAAAHPHRRVPSRRRRAPARRSTGKYAVPTPDETRPATQRNPGPHRTDTTATRTAPHKDPRDRT